MSIRTRFLAGALALVALAALLAACSAQSTSALVAKTWQLTLISEKQPSFQGAVPVDQQANYTVAFNSDGTANIKADCNNVSATWREGAGASLTITPGASTTAACGPTSMGDRFVRDLGNTVSFGVNGSTLALNLKDGGALTFDGK